MSIRDRRRARIERRQAKAVDTETTEAPEAAAEAAVEPVKPKPAPKRLLRLPWNP